MAKKREIYGRLGVQLRNNRRVFRAEKIAPGAFGLYCFCILDARAELPDQDGKHPPGFVAEEVVLGALGRPHRERLAQAEALCVVDLLERVDGGFVVIKYDEHNDTWSDVCANRSAALERKHRSRPPVGGHASVTPSVTRDNSVPTPECHGEVPISISISSSADQKIPEDEIGERARPPWWEAACDTVEGTTGERFDRGAAWLRYWGHRRTAGKRIAQPDAVYWLTTVDAREAKLERQRARERADNAARRGAEPPGAREHRKTKAQLEAESDERMEIFKRLQRETAAKAGGA